MEGKQIFRNVDTFLEDLVARFDGTHFTYDTDDDQCQYLNEAFQALLLRRAEMAPADFANLSELRRLLTEATQKQRFATKH
ncbi:hypothetical protein AAHC03_013373 [Spirometra sp. Aus1]